MPHVWIFFGGFSQMKNWSAYKTVQMTEKLHTFLDSKIIPTPPKMSSKDMKTKNKVNTKSKTFESGVTEGTTHVRSALQP